MKYNPHAVSTGEIWSTGEYVPLLHRMDGRWLPDLIREERKAHQEWRSTLVGGEPIKSFLPGWMTVDGQPRMEVF